MPFYIESLLLNSSQITIPISFSISESCMEGDLIPKPTAYDGTEPITNGTTSTPTDDEVYGEGSEDAIDSLLSSNWQIILAIVVSLFIAFWGIQYTGSALGGVFGFVSGMIISVVLGLINGIFVVMMVIIMILIIVLEHKILGSRSRE